MNTWNPGMARCVAQSEFYENYREFVLQRNEDHLLRKVACIHGRPVDLWHLYNLTKSQQSLFRISWNCLHPWDFLSHQ